MLSPDRQANIDKAVKALYDYIDSLPPGKREKALEYQAELVRKAEKSPNGMMDVCMSEMKKLNSKLEKSLKSFVDIVNPPK